MSRGARSRRQAVAKEIATAQEVDVDTADARLASLAALIETVEALEDDDSFNAECDRLQRIHGDHHMFWSARVRRLIAQKEFDQAQALIKGRGFHEYDDAGRIAQAEFLYDARAHDDARELYTQLIGLYPNRRDIHVSYAKRLLADGFLVRAHALISPFQESFSEGTKSRALHEKAAALVDQIGRAHV